MIKVQTQSPKNIQPKLERLKIGDLIILELVWIRLTKQVKPDLIR